MSDASTKRMLRRYEDMADVPSFFASYFQTRPENLHTSEAVELDVERNDPDLAIVVSDISADGNQNEHTKYTNKEFIPPIFKERLTVTSFDMQKRQAGQTPFEAPDYRANVVMQTLKAANKMEQKIRRSIEKMAAQVMQTGKITLKNEAGVDKYTMDFSMKSSHIVTVGNDWNGGSATPLPDIEGLAEVCLRDGKHTPNKLAFGRLAWQDFLADTEVQNLLDKRRIDIGQIGRPRGDSNGGMFHGSISVGSYEFELWTYRGWHIDPQSGLATPYLDDDLVVMTSDAARYDLSFGDIPRIPGAPNNALQYVPRRLSAPAAGMDMIVHAWFSEEGTHLNVSVGSRPLTIPVAIDTIGVLNTRA